MFYTVLLLVAFSGVYANLGTEPKCISSFDFEHKWLEKVIRMEVQFDIWKQKLEEDMLKFSNDAGQLKTDFTDMMDKVNTMVAKMDNTIATFEETADKKIRDYGSSMDQIQTSLHQYYQTWNETADTKLKEIQHNADQKLAEISELAAQKYVVFHVRDVHGTVTANNVIKFSEVVVNTNTVYNLDTGTFTSPRKGTYWFSAQLCTHAGKHLSPSIFINGHLVSRQHVGDSGWGSCSSVTAVAMLQVGDTVTLKAGPSMYSNPVWTEDRKNKNAFMGLLIN